MITPEEARKICDSIPIDSDLANKIDCKIRSAASKGKLRTSVRARESKADPIISKLKSSGFSVEQMEEDIIENDDSTNPIVAVFTRKYNRIQFDTL